MEEYLGVIKLFTGTYVPQYYLPCDGRLLPISNYNALYAILGTQYGGDGRTTFGLPDLRSRVPLGQGQGKGLSNYDQGDMDGKETVTLRVDNLPPHNHTGKMIVSSAESKDSVPTPDTSIGVPGAMSGRAFIPSLGYVNSPPNVPLNKASMNIDATGSGVPASIVQPYLALTYMICVEGIYPPRPY